MTEILYEGRAVKKMEFKTLGENLVSFKLTFENGKVQWVGYFREET